MKKILAQAMTVSLFVLAVSFVNAADTYRITNDESYHTVSNPVPGLDHTILASNINGTVTFHDDNTASVNAYFWIADSLPDQNNPDDVSISITVVKIVADNIPVFGSASSPLRSGPFRSLYLQNPTYQITQFLGWADGRDSTMRSWNYTGGAIGFDELGRFSDLFYLRVKPAPEYGRETLSAIVFRADME